MNTTLARPLDVICVGNAVIDTFLTIHNASDNCRINGDHNELCVKYGQKIQVEDSQMHLGGNACNIATGLSRLGYQVGVCAEIGNDEFAQLILNTLKEEHVDSSCVMQNKEAQSSFCIGINFHSERTLFVRHVHRKHDFIFPQTPPQWMYLTSLGKEWIAPYKKAFSYAMEHKSRLAFNPGTIQIKEGFDTIEPLMEKTELFFCNKEEAQIILATKQKKDLGAISNDIAVLLQGLKACGPKLVVITDGKHGSYVIDEQGTIHHSAIIQRDVVEKTGAGDAFASGFFAGYMQGKSIEEAMRWGTVNATSVIGKIGAQAGLLHEHELEKEVQHHQNLAIEIL